MGMLRIMSRRGDDRVQWDMDLLQDGEIEAIAAVREAERIFAEQRARGATAFKVSKGLLTAEQAVVVKMMAKVKSKGSNNWTDADFTTYNPETDYVK